MAWWNPHALQHGRMENTAAGIKPPSPTTMLHTVDWLCNCLQTQSWRMWQVGAAQVPMTPSVAQVLDPGK